MKTLVCIGLVVAVLGIAGAAAWLARGATEAAVEPQTIAVTRGTIEDTVLASGALGASAVTSVGAQVSGTIKDLRVALGDSVAPGDVIAEIDSLTQSNALRAAEASLASVTAQRQARISDVATSEAALARATQLKDKALLSDADYQTALAAVTTAEAQVAALDAQVAQAVLAVESAELDLSRTTISAPVAGTVVAVLVSEGQSVNASQTAPTIVKIANLDRMIIKAQISEADVTRVAPGQSAYFTILGEPDTRLEAELLSVEPAPDAIATEDSGIVGADSAVYYNGLLAVENPDHKLRIAMTAQVTIIVQSAENVLVLPASVLGTAGRDGTHSIEVLDPATGTIRPVTVRVGLNDNITAEIIDGLNEGDLVIGGSAASPAGGATPGGGMSGMGPPPGMMGL